MPSRRKVDTAKIRAEIEAGTKNRDDGLPWFLVREFPPPELREVRAIWRDGLIALASRHRGAWLNDLWCIHRVARSEPPVGWKPLTGIQSSHGCQVGGAVRLPSPLEFGIQVT